MSEGEPLLIVDDDSLVLGALEAAMLQEGYRVYTAKDGEEALKIASHFFIKLIICDHRMPGMSGIEVLEAIQQKNPDVIRILLTANTEQDTAIQAINVGQVHYFIPKPWDDDALRHTVKIFIEKFNLRKQVESMQELMVEHHEELEKAHKSLKHQIQLGGKVHETLLLGQIPSDIPGISICGATVPSEEIDGDFFEFYRPLYDVFDVVIGDVMGKGLPAALVGTAVKTQLVRFAVPPTHPIVFDRETYWHEDVLSLKDIMENVQKSIVKELLELEYFVSLFYARYDLKKRTLTYINCGFTKPIHYKAREKKIEFLAASNFPLGTKEDESYNPIEIDFNENDIFVFYSDGVTEARSPSKAIYDISNLMAIVEKNFDKTAEEILHLIKQDVMRFHEKDIFDDDLSIIVLKIDHFLKRDKFYKGRHKFYADFSELNAVRELIEKECAHLPGNMEKLAQDLKLAINEVFCNIVKHGYKENPGGPIFIQIEHDKEGIKVEISDQGARFNPLILSEPSLFGDKDDGFGWYIVRQLVDKVMYLPKQSEDGSNHLRIFKRYIEKAGMEIEFKKNGEVLILTPTGDTLDAKESPDFKERVLSLIVENKANQVVFDMQNLQFIDSSGLGCFLSILRRLNADSGTLKLASLTKPVKSMFELVSMHKIFDIYPSVEEALRSSDIPAT